MVLVAPQDTLGNLSHSDLHPKTLALPLESWHTRAFVIFNMFTILLFVLLNLIIAVITSVAFISVPRMRVFEILLSIIIVTISTVTP